ncbi:MAG TPA: DUF4476 domain-containing protein [Myxococcota bacterium]|nr:DUF4476 domain-containing protein [Myxococcota bacterium]HRY95523.1 DUF4476 domain-containing protein [Myxococcota bacterium]HSA19925.1 DUF4476 domain-containing protein [Myxococcota bacterium]
MRTIGAVIGISAWMLAAGPAWAGERQVRRALDAVRDAIERVEDEGGACRKAVLRDLEGVRKDLKEMREDASRKALRRVARDLKDVAREAEDECGKKVVRLLEEARDELRDAGEDHGGGRHHERDEERPAAPPCWEGGDPGCGHTRGGVFPMDAAAFQSLLGAVRGAKPNVFGMLDIFKATLGNQAMTCRQLARVVAEFKPHVFQMLDVVKAAAPRVVDPQNAGVVTPVFQPHTFQMQDAAQILGAQQAD